MLACHQPMQGRDWHVGCQRQRHTVRCVVPPRWQALATPRMQAAPDLALACHVGTPHACACACVPQGHVDMVCEKNADVVHDFMADPLKLTRVQVGAAQYWRPAHTPRRAMPGRQPLRSPFLRAAGAA